MEPSGRKSPDVADNLIDEWGVSIKSTQTTIEYKT